MTEGSHTVELRVYDNAGNFVSDAYAFTVTLSEDPDDTPVVPRDDNSLLYLVGAAAVAAVISIAAFMVMRRKR